MCQGNTMSQTDASHDRTHSLRSATLLLDNDDTKSRKEKKESEVLNARSRVLRSYLTVFFNKRPKMESAVAKSDIIDLYNHIKGTSRAYQSG